MKSADEILKTLRDKRDQLVAAGIAHAAIFGSAARNEAQADSDVDILVELTPTKPRTLIAIARAIQAVEDVLGEDRVDVAVEDVLRPEIRSHVLREAQFAF